MENIYITWHYTTHGLAYLKHVLSQFYLQPDFSFDRPIDWRGLDQAELNEVFDKKKKGFTFAKIYYLTVEEKVIRKITDRRKYRKNRLTDKVIEEAETQHIWEALFDNDDPTHKDYTPCLQRDLEFVKTKYTQKEYDKFCSQIWRDMQHYSIQDQIKWFLEYSNAKNIYNNKFEECQTKVNNLRDVNNIAKEVKKIVRTIFKNHPKANFYINISLGSSETQVVWHALSQANYLPENCKFLQTYDDKNDSTQSFKKFRINEVPVHIFDELQLEPVFKNPKSKKRLIANLKMEYYIKSGFIILILGERGTGKSAITEEHKDKKQNFVSVNCASFDDDSKAESALFGYVKGAFTGANKDAIGLFQKANNGILFLDEIHHLSKRVQGKLMKAIQTDENNFFHIRKMGSIREEKIKCTTIFASNRSVDELRDKWLYEDFFDRISQNVIEMPSLRETLKDREQDWKSVWERMKFEPQQAPQNTKFLKWLKKLDLHGNFRDLEKIAIYCHNYQNFNADLKDLLKEEHKIRDEFQYAQKEFEKLQSRSKKQDNPYFSTAKSIHQMEGEFHRELAIWLNQVFGSMEKASDFFQAKFDKTIQPRTLYKWKNGK